MRELLKLSVALKFAIFSYSDSLEIRNKLKCLLKKKVKEKTYRKHTQYNNSKQVLQLEIVRCFAY